MKRILSIVLILMMMFLICSCGVNVVELDGENKGYYYEYSEDIEFLKDCYKICTFH